MIRYLVCVLTGSLLSSVLFLSGCTLRSAPEVKYFGLLTMEQLGDSRRVGVHPEMKLGIGPLTIPDSLQRSQIVTRHYENQFQFDEYNRWAGVLEKDLLSAIGDNLSVLLAVENVGFFPWMSYFTPTCSVAIDIQRFDGALNGQAALEAKWRIIDPKSSIVLQSGRSVLRRPSAGPGYPGLVKALSSLVADLSYELAVKMEKLIGEKTP